MPASFVPVHSTLMWGLTAALLPGAQTLAAPPGTPAEEPSALRFREVSEDWGLVFRHHHGGSGERYMVETVVGGVVVFDHDGDGDPDVFFVDGGRLPGYRGEEPRSRLFRNDRGRFVDVTGGSGIEVSGYGSGAVAGDVDGDLDLDLYVTELGANQLFLNRGDGTFRDATAEAGVGDPSWSASATLFDADLDGDLDLYVTNYVAFTLEKHKFCGDAERGIQGYCHPDAYPGVPDRFYRNLGPLADGSPEGRRFEDATAEAGLGGADHAGLGVVAGDLDGDGWPDLYVANDAEPNFLFRNRGASPDGASGGVAFEDVSVLSGTSHGEEGKAEGGMGVDLGDVDGDGRLDVVVTNFEIETNALYRNLGSGLFADARFATGVASGSRPMLAFGVAFADFDHDRDPDLAVANGHILDNAAVFRAESRYAQRNQVYENRDGRLREVEGAGLEAVRVSRGLAVGDLDGDGDPDLVIVNSDDLAEVYENLAGSARGGWLRVDLRSREGNRFGVGARLELETPEGEGRQVREVRTASSYLSQSEMTSHFGLGEAEEARLRVRWPGGKVVVYEGLEANRRVTLIR